MTTVPVLGVGDLLARLASELLSLQAMTAEIEQALGDLLPAAHLDAGPLRTLQHLDLLNQSLQALASVCTSSAALASAEWSVDAAKAAGHLPLAALARRLTGEPAATPAEHGDELFAGD